MDMIDLKNLGILSALCAGLGAMLKHTPLLPNKWIPLALLVVGVGVGYWMEPGPEGAITGAMAALGTTGMHQQLKQVKKHE